MTVAIPIRALLLALLVACGGCDEAFPGRRAEVDRAVVEARVRQYFERVADLPDNVRLEFAPFTTAPVDGWLRGELAVVSPENRERVPLLVSRDGRYLIQGELADLTVDPYAAAMAQIALDGAPRRGDPRAPVTIVAYVDFQCPFSARAMHTLQRFVLPAYGERVQLVVKDFPLANAHPWAEAAARAAACAMRQTEAGYWTVAERFFRLQEELEGDDIRDTARAALRGLDIDQAAFLRCFDEETLLPEVQADVEEGRRLGLRSTPTFFINGRKLEGARPFEELQAAIDAALAHPASAGRLAQDAGSPP